jgi:hypothetical protein
MEASAEESTTTPSLVNALRQINSAAKLPLNDELSIIFTPYQPQMMLLTLQRYHDKETVLIPATFKVLDETLNNLPQLAIGHRYFLLTQESSYSIFFEDRYIMTIGTVSVWRAINRENPSQDPIYLYADEH